MTDLPPDLQERRRQIRMHRWDLKDLLNTCPHLYVHLEKKEYNSLITKSVCKICDHELNIVHGRKCEKSPDKICHYHIMIDRDGVLCVELADGTLDHNFPRSDEEDVQEWIEEYKTENCCTYCGLKRKVIK